MTSIPDSTHNQGHLDQVFLYALHALPTDEMAVVRAQISRCKECQQEMETLAPVVQSFAGWPADVLRPSESLWERLAQRLATDTGAPPSVRPLERSSKPEWEEAAPGIHIQILAVDAVRDTVSMLVRLDVVAEYPGHVHAGIEELHLLHGVLKVDDRTFYPGDFIRAEAGSVDHRVWTETGCTCFVVTSTRDVLL